MHDENNDELIRRKPAATYMDVEPGTLSVWDCTKRYNLEPRKIGKYVYYPKSALDRVKAERKKRKAEHREQ